MEEKKVQSKIRDIAQSPQKLRLVVDQIRGKQADKALDILMVLNKKGCDVVKKGLLSAIANAREIYSVDKDELIVSSVSVDESRTLKRVRFASRGRTSRINKRRSHLNLELKVK